MSGVASRVFQHGTVFQCGGFDGAASFLSWRFPPHPYLLRGEMPLYIDVSQCCNNDIEAQRVLIVPDDVSPYAHGTYVLEQCRCVSVLSSRYDGRRIYFDCKRSIYIIYNMYIIIIYIHIYIHICIYVWSSQGREGAEFTSSF